MKSGFINRKTGETIELASEQVKNVYEVKLEFKLKASKKVVKELIEKIIDQLDEIDYNHSFRGQYESEQTPQYS